MAYQIHALVVELRNPGIQLRLRCAGSFSRAVIFPFKRFNPAFGVGLRGLGGVAFAFMLRRPAFGVGLHVFGGVALSFAQRRLAFGVGLRGLGGVAFAFMLRRLAFGVGLRRPGGVAFANAFGRLRFQRRRAGKRLQGFLRAMAIQICGRHQSRKFGIACNPDKVRRSRETVARLYVVRRAPFIGPPIATAFHRGDERAENGALAQQGDVAEMRAQISVELWLGQFAQVIFIEIFEARGIDYAVGRADNEDPAGTQHPPNLGGKLFMFPDVLEGFKRYNDVDGAVLQRQIDGVALQETKIFELVGHARVCDRAFVDIHSGDAFRDASKYRRSVTLSRRDVEHIQPNAQFTGYAISMEMFVFNLAVNGGCHALASELQRLCRK